MYPLEMHLNIYTNEEICRQHNVSQNTSGAHNDFFFIL